MHVMSFLLEAVGGKNGDISPCLQYHNISRCIVTPHPYMLHITIFLPVPSFSSCGVSVWLEFHSLSLNRKEQSTTDKIFFVHNPSTERQIQTSDRPI